MTETLSETERMPEGEELERMLAEASDRIKSQAARRSRVRRRRLSLLWSGVGAGVIAVSAIAATGPLKTVLIPENGGARASLAVQCPSAGGFRFGTWFETENDKTEAARAEPVAVCDAQLKNAEVEQQIHQIAQQQRALGRQCVSFATTDGERWTITGLRSADSYSALGGPAPGQLPGYRPPAPSASPATFAPSAIPPGGCTELPVVTWRLPVPPMVACTKDDVTISVYPRQSNQTATALCAAKGLVPVSR